MKTTFLTLMLVVLCGCASSFMPDPGQNLQYMKDQGHIGDSKLKDQVSFDLDCPKKKISILKQKEDMGSGNYILKACGKKVKYKRTGTIYSKAKQCFNWFQMVILKRKLLCQ